MKPRHIIGIIMVCVIIVCFVVLGGNYMMENKDTAIQIRTDQEPIYNHFPSLPEAEKILWCSETSAGIGLATTRLYFYALYKSDLELTVLMEEQESEEAVMNPPFYPKEFQEEEKGWKQLNDANFFFQEGIKDYRKMNTAVYINKELKAIYVEAVGD